MSDQRSVAARNFSSSSSISLDNSDAMPCRSSGLHCCDIDVMRCTSFPKFLDTGKTSRESGALCMSHLAESCDSLHGKEEATAVFMKPSLPILHFKSSRKPVLSSRSDMQLY